MGSAPQKPAKGSHLLARRAQQQARRARERSVMAEARRRDRGRCRYPGCSCLAHNLRTDVCHAVHRGSGGDPKGTRTTRETLIVLCLVRHGEWDRGEIEIVPMDLGLGFDGPGEFYTRQPDGSLALVGHG